MELPLYKVFTWLKILEELRDLYVEQTWNVLQSEQQQQKYIYHPWREIAENSLRYNCIKTIVTYKFTLEKSRSYKEYNRDWSQVCATSERPKNVGLKWDLMEVKQS